jgi:hypothetical protein
VPLDGYSPTDLLVLARVADMAFDRIQTLQQNRSRSAA